MMDSLIVKAPANCSRFKSRFRATRNNFLSFNSKHRQINGRNTSHAKINQHHKHQKINNHHNIRNSNINRINRNNKTNQRTIVQHHLPRKILHLECIATTTSNSTTTSNNNNINKDNDHNDDDDDGNSSTTNLNTTNQKCRGDFTRKIYEIISKRTDNTQYIPSDMVQTLFNDMHLFPSKSEVSDMIHSVRALNIRNGKPSTFITTNEFCLLVREMQRFKSYKTGTPKTNKCVKKCEVFLGGSCNPTTWRADTAIPVLQKQGITFYNPQVAMWAPELVAQEHDAKQAASVLLYVVDSQTRSVAGMIEVAYLVSAGRCVVLVADSYKYGQTIMGETLSDREFQDLVDGQRSLLEIVQQQGIKVHKSLASALEHTAGILRNSSTLNGSICNKMIVQKFRKLSDVFNSYDKNRTGDIHIHDALDAYKRITNRSLDVSSIYNYLTIPNNTDRKISFDQFCALIAEFGTDGCESIPINGTISDPLFWTSTLLKTRHLLRFYIVRPITYAIEWARQPLQRQHSTYNNNNHANVVGCDVRNVKNANYTNNYLTNIYLGGSCKTSWRQSAMPLIEKHHLTYYNPTISERARLNTNGNDIISDCDDDNDNVILWKRHMDNCRVLLFVITNDCRSLTSMILAAHYIGLDKPIVLCIQHLPIDDLEIEGEKLTKQAIKDYNRGRVYLADLAKRKSIPVFDNVNDAVTCTIDKCKQQQIHHQLDSSR